MLSQTITTPDTTSYLFLALGLFFSILALFIGSLALRTRNLHRDEAVIEQLNSDQ